MFHGFDYSNGLKGDPKDRLKIMAGAMNGLIAKKSFQKEVTQKNKKQTHRRYECSFNGKTLLCSI